MSAIAKVKINSAISIQPVTKGPNAQRASGLISRNKMIDFSYQPGELPRKFFFSACDIVGCILIHSMRNVVKM